MKGSAARIAVSVIGLIMAAPACALDDRELLVAAGNGGAPFNDGGASGGGGSTGGSGGDAGQGAPTLPVCDYSTGVAAGCETLVQNPGFSKDTSHWLPEDPTVVMSWQSDDANLDKASGSIAVVNSRFGEADGIASLSATQCLPADARGYSFAVDVFIPEGQGNALDAGTYSATAGLSLIFFSSDKCDGYTKSSATSEQLSDPGVWAHREGRATTPDGAQSVLVRLVTYKNFRQYKFEAHFDNVLVKAE